MTIINWKYQILKQVVKIISGSHSKVVILEIEGNDEEIDAMEDWLLAKGVIYGVMILFTIVGVSPHQCLFYC